MSAERDATVALALGRILRLASRPAEPGDIAEYERCRALILDTLQPATLPFEPVPCLADRPRGAAGD